MVWWFVMHLINGKGMYEKRKEQFNEYSLL
jgi:hypothetical protein